MRSFPFVANVAVFLSIFTGPRVLHADKLQPVGRSIAEVVDHYVDSGLKADGLKSASQVDDATFVRRITLDLAGRIPAATEAREYASQKSVDKREKLIDRLMNSPEFTARQAQYFDTFMTNGTGSLKPYLQKAFEKNRSWDNIFRDVLIGNQTDPLTKDASAFLKGRVKDVDALTNDVSIVFFGINVSCAKCHDHPLVDDWKQDHFFGMKSFFNRTFTAGKFLAERNRGDVSFKTTNGETRNARLMFLTGTVIKEPKAKPLSAAEKKKQQQLEKKLKNAKQPSPLPKFSRRKQLVEIALKPGENLFFARAIVNRVWHEYFGEGLVMPLDQMHSENEPSHPQLLEWLARDLVAHNYGLRRLVKGLVNSLAYSRSSRWGAGDRPEANRFAVAVVRPLDPIQMARSLSLASADSTTFEKKSLKPQDRTALISKTATSANSSVFEQPNDNFQVSADEALFFSNSETVIKTYLNGGLMKRLEDLKSPEEVVETAFWSILSRAPSDKEMKLLTDHLNTRKDRHAEACRQVAWTLLSSTEFRFNH